MIDAAVVRLLVFRVGTLSCAAEVETVREILPRLSVTRIPGAPPEVAGMVNVRGALVTVVDGWRALGQAAPAPGAGTTVLLEVDGGRRMVALTVDEVVDLLAVPGETLERRQSLPGLDPTIVRAVGRRGAQAFVVLDTDRLLGPILSS
ncbi:MAG TPA: chemotaxis protein CheW [Gemmatimonadales bacterium]|nr:chemotaxis protein CheW [Gemmatimonadales bacterium]